MRAYEPEKRSMTVLRILSVSAAAILTALTLIFIDIRLLAAVLTAVFWAAVFCVDFFYLPQLFKQLKYTMTDSEIHKKSGVILKTSQSIKYTSVQYTTVIFTPFSAYTGLNFIVFYVYGGQLVMSFLKKKDAEEILKKLDIQYKQEV